MLKLDEGQKWWDASDAIDSGQWFYNDSKILMKHAAKSRLDAVIENEASASANENSSSEVETVPTNIVCSYNGVTNGLLDSCHISFDRLDDTVPSEGYVKVRYAMNQMFVSNCLVATNFQFNRFLLLYLCN